MNENPGETPNPLNPNPGTPTDSTASSLDANPSEPIRPVVFQEPVEEPQNQPSPTPPIKEQMPAEQVVPVTRIASVVTPTPEPMVNPIQSTSEVEPPKKRKRVGLIVAMIACLFVAVGCAVAAVLIFMNVGQSSPVKAAVEKLINNPLASNMEIAGTIDLTMGDDSSPVSEAQIVLNSKINAGSMANETDATIVATVDGVGEVIAGISEIYFDNDALYMKVEGIDDLMSITAATTVTPESLTNCIEDESGESNCITPTEEVGEVEVIESPIECTDGESGCVTVHIEEELNLGTALSGLLEMVDGEWIRIPLDQTSDEEIVANESGMAQCLVNLADGIKQNKNTFLNLYNENEFISDAGGEITIARKKNPIYRLNLDETKLENFVSAASDIDSVKNFRSCVQDDGGMLGINVGDIVSGLSNLPDMYVEIDGNYDITRFYTEFDSEDMGVKIDLLFSYPQSVTIAEPEEYIDLEAMIEQLFPVQVEEETL